MTPNPRMRLPVRRLLLLPAVALVALGAPVLAATGTAPPVPEHDETTVAPASTPVGAGWTSEETPVDATIVGVRWNGDETTEFTVEVRDEDGSWEPAETLAADDTAPDEGTADALREAALPGPEHATEPLWVGTDATAVRVAVAEGTASDVTLSTVDSQPPAVPGGSAGALGLGRVVDGPERYAFGAALLVVALMLIAVALGWSPFRTRRLRRLVGVAAVIAIGAACAPVPPPNAAPPPAMPREQWGGDLPFVCSGGPVAASHLGFAVVHHTAGGNSYSPDQSVAIMRGIYAYHVNTNGYCDVAYNFFVDKYGQIFQGRWGSTSLPIIGGHSGGFNTYSTGIALLGNHDSSANPDVGVSGAAWNALVQLLRWKLSISYVNPAAGFATVVGTSSCNCARWPAGTAVGFPNAIVAHTQLNTTSCPGNLFTPRFDDLRAQVQAGIQFPPTTTTSTTPTTMAATTETVPDTTTTSSSEPTTTSTSTPPPTAAP